MKKVNVLVLCAMALALIFGASVASYAQEDEKAAHQDDKAAQDDKHQDQKEQKDKDEDRNVQRDEKQDHEDKARDEKQEHGDHDAGRDDRQAAHVGGHIPDDRFRANFGRQHVFVINRPVIVEGTPRFQYGGYWFVIAAPWPAGWAYTDQVYVDYINGGYFLLSPVHPGIQISINVIL